MVDFILEVLSREPDNLAKIILSLLMWNFANSALILINASDIQSTIEKILA
jgi:hypothetical protein